MVNTNNFEDRVAGLEGWRSSAECVEYGYPDLWFEEGRENTKLAKTICRKCVVRQECLTEALSSNEDVGTWGGFTSRERRRFRQGVAPSLMAKRAIDDEARSLRVRR